MEYMQKRKSGESEAIQILQNLGIEIDNSYYDDNSKRSMPDIRCKDGRKIEVTHTSHNNLLPKGISKFDRVKPGEDGTTYFQRRIKIETECSRAYERYSHSDYEKDYMCKLTPAGVEQYRKDIKLLKEHWGYDVTEWDIDKRYSEFKCDHPTIVFSTKKILREIIEDKAEKYPEGDVDLFIFVAEEEFYLLKKLLSQVNWNGCATGFLNRMQNSPFKRIYVCEWLFTRQEYNTDNPQLIIFKMCDDAITIEPHNICEAKDLENES